MGWQYCGNPFGTSSDQEPRPLRPRRLPPTKRLLLRQPPAARGLPTATFPLPALHWLP